MMATMNMFETRTMLRQVKQLLPPRTFFTDTFFPTIETSMTENIDIDIIKGGRKLAPFVSSRHEAKTVERKGWRTASYKPPYIKEKMETRAEDFLKRMPGETVYEGDSSPADRAARQLSEDLIFLIDLIYRRMEWMAAKALTTGKITVKGDGIDDEIDFAMNATHIIDRYTTATQRWTHADSNPIKDLETLCKVIRKDSGIPPNKCVLGGDVADAFLNHAKVQNQLDNRRIDLGQINPDDLPDGSTYLGMLKKPRLDLYTYDEWYEDEDTGVTEPMMPENMVIVGSTKARTARHFGAIKDLAFAGLASVPFFPKSWIVEDPSVRWLLVQSAGVPCPHQIDAFGVLQVLP